MSAHQFRSKLREWHSGHQRPMPWKGIRDPYRIWLSEVILQQTRVDQGLPYYERFCKAFPSVHDLAKAPEEEVFKLWEGLGYYRRAKNLLKTARLVSFEMDGLFPDSYEGLLALPGIGPYTAAAIASFAFDLPHAVLDGNVARVLSRYHDLRSPIDSTAGKKALQELAAEHLDHAAPGAYNQAIMDFGASVCKPRSPVCDSCPLAESCLSLERGTVDLLPVKQRKPARRKRFFHYLVVEWKGHTFIRRRGEGDIWQGLYEFPMVEHDMPEPGAKALMAHPDWPEGLPPAQLDFLGSSPHFRQLLTHQEIIAKFWSFALTAQPSGSMKETFRMAKKSELRTFAWPKTLDLFLAQNPLYLK